MSSKSNISNKPKPISTKKFLSLVAYKPKWVGDDLCNWRLIQFREYKGFSPSLEFGTSLHENETQSVYFEILDLNGYKDSDFIPLDSKRRKCVLNVGMTKNKRIFEYAKSLGPEYENVFMTPENAARHINESLKMLYSGKIKSKSST